MADRRPVDDGVVIRSATAQVTVRPGAVTANIGGRHASAFGDTDPLLAACPPTVRASRVPIPLSALDALPPDATAVTVAALVHIAAASDVAGDGSAIPDRWLAARVRVDPGTIRRHRERLRNVWATDRADAASVWRYYSRGWSHEDGTAWVPAGALTHPDLGPIDVAVIAGWVSWADYQGRLHGTWATVADRAHISGSTVTRSVARMRHLGLVVGRRLRVELLVDPHWRTTLRDDLPAAVRVAHPRFCQATGKRARCETPIQ